MPFLHRPCGAKIYYETKGSLKRGGIPVLLLAPGGMRSSIAKWDISPWNPWNELKVVSSENNDAVVPPNRDHFFLIGMDQRFATDRSTAGGTIRKDDGWHTYWQDQMALLDHLQVPKCHLLGSCIGPSYAFRLMKHAPERFGRCVMLQPIGITQHTTEPGEPWKGLNTGATWRWFGDWANEMVQTPTCANPELLRQLHDNMFGYPQRDFVFSISRQDAARIQHPLLVFMGKDISHPSETSREIARIAPRAELVQVWRDAGVEKLEEAAAKIEAFLLADRCLGDGAT